MRNFWLLISVLWLWTCSSGGGSSPTEPQETAPVSNFTATPTTLIQGQAVTFTSTSTGTITSYAWNVDNDPAIEGTTATYSHTYTEVGTYSVTLTVTGPGGSNPKTVADMITVSTAAPTPTTATSQTVQEDGSTTISLTATDPNGQAVTFAITTDPTNGTATLSDSDITYTPNANFYGTDSFDYTASNGTYTSDPVTITITVTGEDDGNPTTNDVSATTDEDTVVTVNLDATEIDGDNYSFSIVSQPTNGTLGSVNGNQVEYTPNQDFNGTDTFTFEATDDRTSRRNVATATITVASVNDAPVANDVTASMDENKIAGRYQPVTITLDATDIEGESLTYSIVGTPSNGTLGSITNNQVVYTPTQDWNGEDTFTYKANDGTDDSNTATVTVTVTSVNDAPVTEDQSASTDEDTAVDITLTATDVENDNLTYTIVSDVSNGTTSLSGTTVTYTPTENFNGTDTFTFKANDGTADSNTSTVTIAISEVNDIPVISDTTFVYLAKGDNLTTTFSLSEILNDDNSSENTFSIVEAPSRGSASIIAGTTFTYSTESQLLTSFFPSTEQTDSGLKRYNGGTKSDTIKIKSNDGDNDSNIATIKITYKRPFDIWIVDNTETYLEDGLIDGNSLVTYFYTYRNQVRIVKIDTQTGDLIWEDKKGNRSWYWGDIAKTSNGDYIYTGGAIAPVGKTSSSGEHLANVSYISSETHNTGMDIIETFDGHIVIGLRKGGLLKVDGSLNNDGTTDGDIIWRKTLNYTDYNYVAETNDNGLITIGHFDSTNQQLLTKTDSAGNVEWTKLFTGYKSRFTTNEIFQTSDGGYMFDSNTILYKVDSQGNQEWTYSTGIDFTFHSFQQTSDGGYIVGGVNQLTLDYTGRPIIVKLTASGSEEWSIGLDGNDPLTLMNSDGTIKFLEETSDGGFILGGNIDTPMNGVEGAEAGWIMKIDSQGNRVWPNLNE